MLTLEDLKSQIALHLDGSLTVEDLAAWAETTFQEAEFDETHVELISEVLMSLRDAVDPHRFRWEEPDFEELWHRLEEETADQ